MDKKATALANELGLLDLSQALRFPRFFEVETVNACNARCAMCTIADWKKRDSYLMSDEVWKKFISEIKQYADWIDRVNVSRDGEPLLDRKLEQKIRSLKKANIRYVTFATNASLLNKERALSLLDSGLDDIMFSVDAARQETFERIRKGLKFDQVVNNCLNFIKIRNDKRYKTTVRVRMVLQDKNRDELKEWFDYWKAQVAIQDRVYAKPAHSWGNQLKGYTGITKSLKKKEYDSQPCVSLWSTMVIKVNGDVPLCPVDFKCKFRMGNIAEDSIREIWNSKLLNEARDKLIFGQRNKLVLCRRCWLWDRSTVIRK